MKSVRSPASWLRLGAKQRLLIRHRINVCAYLVSYACSLIAAAALSQAAPAAVSRPNIIFILTDDMGIGDIGCYGGKFAPTPNIDRLAREGVRFTQYYCPSPICSPSRTGVTTGMHPARWRITSFLHERKENR